ncbi:bifunctional DNA-formamidopyrimidine glycosylase/DNA-(apurinic or apyrimidinic site) lyase [candidate division WOR-3 bacterium]|nr:bifunctional DNA-formamidopyrimidine glycosylase/DNA-(apurinic or apyrimidinic site) lyase [candidate division WOR-3 bacterium]
MPELPEVETIRRLLGRQLAGKRVEAVTFGARRVTMYPRPAEFKRQLIGVTVLGVGRRGKYLTFDLSNSRKLVLHLGMSGQVRRFGQDAMHKHEHMRLRFSDGETVSFVDARRFGKVCLTDGGALPKPIKGMERMGPEPIATGYSAAFLAACLSGRSASVKNLLLDQRVACGVGNIYSDEALHRAGVRPSRRAGSLKPSEVSRLTAAMGRVLKDGIRWCGTTMKDGGYVLVDGTAGAFQNRLRVYGREGEKCRRRGCKGVIQRKRIGGRSTHFCSACQK